MKNSLELKRVNLGKHPDMIAYVPKTRNYSKLWLILSALLLGFAAVDDALSPEPTLDGILVILAIVCLIIWAIKRR
jgi:hypothetical protein